MASSILKDLGLERHSPEAVWVALAAWLVFNLALFLGPLLVFSRPLYRVRERALLEYGQLANQHHLAFNRKWIGEAGSGEDLLGTADPASVADLNACVEIVREMRVVPVDLAALMQLAVAAGVPLLAVVATQMPLDNLFKWVAHTIL